MIQIPRKKHIKRIAGRTSLLRPVKIFFLYFNREKLGALCIRKGSQLFFGACLILASIALNGCALVASRPVQEMSDTAAAIRAAREVQADTLSPELYRLAGEWFFKAKHEYKFKNFLIAKEFADRSRYYAEMAEYESIARGASRTDTSSIKDPLDDTGSLNTGKPQAEPYAYPTPAGTPADEYDQRKAADDKAAEDRATAAQAAAQPAAKTPAGGGAAAAPFYPNPSPSTPSTATPSAGRR